MQVVREDSYETMSQRAAEWIAAEIHSRREMLLVAASGATPTRTYELFASRRRDEPHLFDRVRLVKLDEWWRLERTDAATCEAYLQRHLVGPLGLSADRYLSFRSDAEDPDAECRRVGEQLQKWGRVGLCVLGLGVNGHLGLNEPADVLQPYAHVAVLSEATGKHPMLASTSGPVTRGLTLGMVEILGAARIVLLVSGAHKAEPMRQLLSGQIATNFPVSLLWMHPDVTCFCDRLAAPENMP
jgi:galactosamine-6-phosphate isomerase